MPRKSSAPAQVFASRQTHSRTLAQILRFSACILCGVVLVCLVAFARLAIQPAPAGDRPTPTENVTQLMPQNQPVGVQQTRFPIPEGRVYFVAPDGSPTNSGTTINSPTTLQKALEMAPQGATIVLRGGTYRTGYRRDENSGGGTNETTLSTAVTIQPYEDEKPILKGSLLATDWMQDGNAWKTSWQYTFPPGRNNVKEATERNPMAAYNDGVWMDGKPLWQVASRSELQPDRFYLDYDSKNLYIGTDPTGKTIEATAYSTGLRTQQMRQAGVTIRGLTLMHYANTALSIDSPKALIENNVLTQNRNAGFFIGNSGVQRFQSLGVDAIVRYNDLTQNGTQGGGTVRGHRLLFEHNRVQGNNTKLAGFSSGGVKFVLSDGITVRHNLIEENEGVGIWFDVGCTQATIVNNVAQRNTTGIYWEISDRGIIAANLLAHNQRGVWISGSTNTQIYNNTFHANSTTILSGDYDRTEQQGPGYIANVAIQNNLFSVDDRNADRILLVRTSICTQPLVSNLDYNAYYRSNPNQPKQLIEWEKYPYDDRCPRQNGTLYSQLADFQTDVNFEQHGFELSGNPNPFFVDAANGNYALQANSPARRAGTPLPAAIAEAIGWTPGTAVDLGAYQSR